MFLCICELCGDMFLGKRENALYCSQRCRNYKHRLEHPDYYKEYYDSNNEKFKKYRDDHKEYIKEYGIQYRIENKERIDAQHKFKRDNDPLVIERRKKRLEETGGLNREERLMRDGYLHYGDICVFCGCSDKEALCFDHVADDGKEHRENENVRGKIAVLAWLKRNGWPNNIVQTVCYNCNARKERRKSEMGNNKKTRKFQRVKKEVFNLLGNRCFYCGEKDVMVLDLDHIQNDGFIERKSSNRIRIYKNALLPENKEKYQLLCSNCNTIKENKRRKEKVTN